MMHIHYSLRKLGIFVALCGLAHALVPIEDLIVGKEFRLIKELKTIPAGSKVKVAEDELFKVILEWGTVKVYVFKQALLDKLEPLQASSPSIVVQPPITNPKLLPGMMFKVRADVPKSQIKAGSEVVVTKPGSVAVTIMDPVLAKTKKVSIQWMVNNAEAISRSSASSLHMAGSCIGPGTRSASDEKLLASMERRKDRILHRLTSTPILEAVGQPSIFPKPEDKHDSDDDISESEEPEEPSSQTAPPLCLLGIVNGSFKKDGKTWKPLGEKVGTDGVNRLWFHHRAQDFNCWTIPSYPDCHYLENDVRYMVNTTTGQWYVNNTGNADDWKRYTM